MSLQINILSHFLYRVHDIIEYLNFRANSKSRGGHGIHSPFIYELYTQSIDIDSKVEIFNRIEKIRKELLKNKTIISKDDFGAGSKQSNSKEQTIKDITKLSAVKPFTGRLLYRLVNYLKPDSIIELGTSVGVSTCYLAAGNDKSKVYSLEGDKSLVKIAAENLNKLGLGNVNVICGDFDTQIPILLSEISKCGIIFIDGNHTEEATLRYFKYFSEKADSDTLIIFDDIRWSNGMQSAWKNICDDKNVSISVDLFNCGLAFFRKGVVKQHFNLRYGPF